MRKLPGARPLNKSALAAGVSVLGGMAYWVMQDASARQRDARDARAAAADQGSSSAALLTDAAATVPAARSKAASTQAPPFLGSSAQPTAENVPKFMLASTNLDAEQKLQVALCRRQAWIRAAQLGPTLALCGYSACVMTEAAGLAKLPRGSKTAVPLGLFVVGMTVGSYLGGLEGKPTMNAALLAKPIEGVHVPRSERAPEEDALVSFMKAARDAPQRA